MRKIISVIIVLSILTTIVEAQDLIVPMKPTYPTKPVFLLTEPIYPIEPGEKASPYWSILPFGVPQFINGDNLEGLFIMATQGLGSLFLVASVKYLSSSDSQDQQDGKIRLVFGGLVFSLAHFFEVSNSMKVYNQYKSRLTVYNNALIEYPDLVKSIEEIMKNTLKK